MASMSRRRVFTLSAAAGAAGAVSALGLGALPQAVAANNNQVAWDFLLSKGFSKVQAAGFIGNWIVESGADPIDPASHQVNGPGRGIAQWEGPRRTDLYNFANQRGVAWQNLGLQLDFVWHELMGKENRAYRIIKDTTTVDSATLAVRQHYERPGVHHDDARKKAANLIYSRHAGGDSTPPPPPSTNTSFPPLRRGAKGTAVRSMQYFLRDRGYTIDIDSSFGPATEQVVKTFQSRNNLEVDGRCGPKTWMVLLVPLRRGAKRAAVNGLQLELRDAGYNVAVDGSFGPATEEAVRAFQTKMKLEVDGSAGPATWGALVD